MRKAAVAIYYNSGGISLMTSLRSFLTLEKSHSATTKSSPREQIQELDGEMLAK